MKPDDLVMLIMTGVVFVACFLYAVHWASRAQDAARTWFSKRSNKKPRLCGYEFLVGGKPFYVCELPKGHRGLHRESRYVWSEGGRSLKESMKKWRAMQTERQNREGGAS